MSPSPASRAPAQESRWSWHNPATRAFVYQVLMLALVGLGIWYLVSNTRHNLAVRNISSGFAFLGGEAGFGIGESVISYSAADTYGRAVLVGLLNTLRVSVVGIVAATVLGTVLGIGRLSRNWLIARLCGIYIEVMRNVPLLIQLFFWYAFITEALPAARDALTPLPGVFLSNRGLMVPWLVGPAMDWIFGGLALAIALIVALAHWARRHHDATGKDFPLLPVALLLLVLLPLGLWWISGSDLSVDRPALKGFRFQGGLSLSPEFSALLAGLVIYTSAYIAEVVRSGILAVNKGQWEAAASLGLSRLRTLRMVVLPQAMRVMIPSMTSQYLNLVKNSSLAVAIGYPDIVSVANTMMNQTGQAIEGVMIIMAVYLVFSLSISVFMNWYDRRMALVER